MSEARPIPEDLFSHANFVRRLARSLLVDGDAAEDVVQETLERALTRPPRGDARAWLARVARNFAHRRRRSESRRAAREERSARPEAQLAVDRTLAREETLQRVVDAVRALDEPYRGTVLARFYEDLPPREIARRAGVPVETVHSRLQRALTRLRRTLAHEGQDYRASLGLLAGSSPCLPPHAEHAHVLPIGLTKAALVLVTAVIALAAFALFRRPSGSARVPSVLATVPVASTSEANAAPLAPREAVEPSPSSPTVPAADRSASAQESALSGTLEVSVLEGPGRRPVEAFRVVVHGKVETDSNGGTTYHGYRSQNSEGGRWTCQWPLADATGQRLHVVLTEPAVKGASLEQEIELLPGETERVVFVLPERERFRGQVVDPAGLPVAGAFVFFGPEAYARGDEPFKPFRPERVRDGVRTDENGWFELRGEGVEITAWQEAYSAATVSFANAGRIQLAPRAALRGTVLDERGLALAGAELRLDQPRGGPTSTTDGDGRFAFEGVEAGAHALWFGETILVGVRLAAGADADVVVHVPHAGLLALDLPAGVSLDERGRGVLVGCEREFGLYEVRAGSAATLAVEQAVRPGRYWLATSSGVAARVTVPEGVERVTVELGGAELRVKSASAVRLHVVPQDADAFTGLMAARAAVRLAAGGEARFRLEPGRYRIVGSAGKTLREVELPAEGAALVLE